MFATAAGEQISSSDTDDEHMENELTSRSAAEATASSSEIEPLVDTDAMPGANHRRKASTAQRGYQKRRRTGKAQPGIPVLGFSANLLS